MYKHQAQRVGVFVDVGNMYHSAKKLFNARLNFQEVLKAAVDGRDLIRAIAYVIQSNSDEESAFFKTLDRQSFEVKMKDLQIFAGGAKKGDWDVGLSVDTIKMADKLDTIILVTGDGDYVPLVMYLQENKGCLVEVIGFGETTSIKLKEIADDFLNLSENKRKFLIKLRK